MDVSFLTPDGIQRRPPGDVDQLLARADGFTWVDIPAWEDEAERLLRETLHCHELVIAACRQRNHVPTVHGYQQHLYVVLHAPLIGYAGHVHLLELDQLIGRTYLVTVHGPINPAVDPTEALRETDGVRRRIEEGRFRPQTPAELSYAVGSAVARRQRDLVGKVAERIPAMEEQVMAGDFKRPEDLLEQLFLIRHELITGRTMSAQSYDVYARMASLERFIPEADRGFARDLTDQFNRVRSIAEGESQFLFGVIELYQTRVTTKMTVAMERLAVIAAITLPVTALASVFGMNVIVNDRTHVLQLVLILAVMASISALLLRWAKRQGWW